MSIEIFGARLTRQERFDYGLQRIYPRPWGNLMTCCVAALCDKGKSVVLVADKMIGTPMIEGEPEITKILWLHPDWRIMIAGDDICPAFPIIASAKERLRRHRGRLTVEHVMDCVYECYSKEREKVAEAVYLKPRGWTISTFNSRASVGIIPKRTRKELGDKFSNQKLEVTFLIAGFDGSGKGHIFSLDEYEHRGHPRKQDIPGFHAIGSGGPGAIYMMTYRDVSSSMPLRLMIYYALEGKYFGELAGSVGTRTDLLILRSGKPPFKIKEKVLDKKLFRLCQKIQPRNLTQSHVDALNGLIGSHFNEIPKLKTKKEEGELIITAERTISRKVKR